MTFVPVDNSTFLQFAGYGIADQNQTVAAAYGISDAQPFNGNDEYGINVALVLPRVTDPTIMLAGDWASRQQTIQSLNSTNSLWTTYGADQTQFNTTVTYLTQTLGLSVLDSTNSNYITSAESRTIWVAINTQSDFQKLFGTELEYSSSADLRFWNGSLSLPTQLTVAGLWFDTSTVPNATNMAPGVSVTLPAGPQSIGSTGNGPSIDPQDVASLYNYPLNGAAYQTGTIGLIEPGVGTYLAGDPTGTQFQSRLTQFLHDVGTSGNGTVYVQGINGQEETSSERSLDIGIAAAINPNSNLALYNGSGDNDINGNAQSSTFTAIQSAIWGTATNPPANNLTAGTPPVTTNSWGDSQAMAPGSPFYLAYMQLYVDAALMSQTTLIALGDGGSGNQTANGIANVETNITSAYNILVSGSSLSRLGEAELDPTLNSGADSLYQLALAGDPQTIWTLVSGGLSAMPSAANPENWLVETVWNDYETTNNQEFVGGNGGSSYTQNHTGAGGMDTTQSTPLYQADFGLTSAIYSALALTGRGLPDVAAPAGGNLYYVTPDTNMNAGGQGSGTSAATPFWTSLITQINYVFNDQHLPNLGYMTDLLYMAAVIAPGSFNDISMGNNTSSYTLGGAHYGGINPTGTGYEAGAGYDLASGLGSPNGLLLARALTEIAHSQVYFSTVPDVIDSDNAGGWTSGTSQTLLLQTTATTAASVDVHTGADVSTISSAASGSFAWTSQFAQQSLQSGFDPGIVALFDGQAQGALTQTTVAAGETLSVDFNGTAATAAQANLSSSFGFADFYSNSTNYVRVAQSVAVAETANGADDVNVVVRVRQSGMADVSLKFYEVDDQNGTIGGLAPGAAGYAAAADAHAFSLLTAGGTSLNGPGFGNFVQDQLTNVDAGQFIAMELTNVTSGDVFWAFSQANEVVAGAPVAHLWNYGANTWGWEDVRGGGDHDFNDLVVQFDFTSTAGHGLLVT